MQIRGQFSEREAQLAYEPKFGKRNKSMIISCCKYCKNDHLFNPILVCRVIQRHVVGDRRYVAYGTVTLAPIGLH